jgi:hypothetical protein
LVKTLLCALAACSVPDLDLTGKQCPCPTGYVCDTSRNMCERSLPSDGRAIDSSIDSGNDANPFNSCLTSAPYTHLAYSTPTFGDFSTAWTPLGGIWSAQGAELAQTSTTASLAVAYHSVVTSGGTADYRLVTTMHATTTGAGDAIELSLRIDATNVHMYHCNWQPSDGGFVLQRTDNISTTHVIAMTTVDVSQIPASTPQVMEFQATGGSFECCLRGVTGAHLSGSDTMYTSGAVGVKTYLMGGGFHDFSAYTQ